MTDNFWTDELVLKFMSEFATLFTPDEQKTKFHAFKASRPTPDWEILEGFNGDHGRHPWVVNDGSLINDCLSKHCRIWSVRRSDGEVFTVGEEVKYSVGTMGGPIYKIDRFEADQENMRVIGSYTNGVCDWKISEIKKEWLTKENQDFLADLGSGKVKLKKNDEWVVVDWKSSDGVYIDRIKGDRVINAVKRLSDGEVFTVGDEVAQQFVLAIINKFDLNSAGALNVWVKIHDRELLTSIKFLDKTTRAPIPPAANGKVPVWLTPEDAGKLGRLLALFIDPMAGIAQPPAKPDRDSAALDRVGLLTSRGVDPGARPY
jgi:hypothetical protein